MKQLLLSGLLLLLSLCGSATALAPSTTGRPLAEALNPDGTLKAGATGSFDARAFRMRTGPNGRPVFRPAGALGAGDERWQNGFGLNGTNGTVDAVLRSGTDIYIGGTFTTVGNVVANRVAKWNGTAWSPLGTNTANGVSGAVTALALAGNGDVYAGGFFTQAGGAAANRVAKWNGAAWSPLDTGTANGINNTVFSLAVAGNGDVYAGGYFTRAGDVVAYNVARWNGTAWSSLGTGTANGLDSSVTALAVAGNGDVYAGGLFRQAGSVAANRVARWDGTTWSPLGTGTNNGMNNEVRTLVVASNGDVYAGGFFTQAGGLAANFVAKWNGAAWNSLGTGTANGMNVGVPTLALAGNGDLYAGGNFTVAGGVAANRVARWDGTAWSSLGTGTSNGVSQYINALAVAGNGDVYVGGNFNQAGGTVATRVAKWNGTAWSPLASGRNNGLNTDNFSQSYALAVAGNGNVYAGGNFTEAGDASASGVAKWDGAVWSPLGSGMPSISDKINALVVAANGDVYAGGLFRQAGGVAANNVAKWNGSIWSALGVGLANGVNQAVYTLALAGNGDVYVGGYFTQAGGAAANNVARWNGTAWSSLGTGISTSPYLGGFSKVTALAVAGNGDVYAGGYFTQAGGVAANNVARWNGTAWSSLGAGPSSGMNDGVNALAVAGNGDVYAGGFFTQTSGAVGSNVVRWNGTTWNPLGAGFGVVVNYSGLSSAILTLAVAGNGDVYAGGFFAQAGGVAANNVAQWNGTAWSPLGSGTNDYVDNLVIGSTGKIYVHGSFGATGDSSKAMVGFGIYNPSAPLATKATAATPAAQIFPNPAHGTATLRLPAGTARQPLTLSDALGRLVRQYPAPVGAEAVLDLRGLPAGTYLVRCGELTHRLVVE
ncbi:hypothetical protein GCM10022409_40140 [Hymenobacter glaciei]|uniref:Secretion system C-terminal sorting domain-containing protein n=1 Tax=Hymenobacter glaciei TaxID=877209 RepID=A0ABP7UQ17_9BACT